MIDHLTVSVQDLGSTREFYTKVLKPLGYALKRDYGEVVGFGDERKPYFWLKQSATPTTPQHLAFVARSRGDVDAFHQAALAAGAKDDGAPGVREEYHANYYGAFVIDPYNGHPIEAVCHTAPVAAKKAKPAAKAKKKPAKKSKR